MRYSLVVNLLGLEKNTRSGLRIVFKLIGLFSFKLYPKKYSYPFRKQNDSAFLKSFSRNSLFWPINGQTTTMGSYLMLFSNSRYNVSYFHVSSMKKKNTTLIFSFVFNRSSNATSYRLHNLMRQSF